MVASRKFLIVTNSYPSCHSPEKVFIYPEVSSLSNMGVELLLLPVRFAEKVDSDLPKGVSYSNELAVYFRPKKLVGIFCHLLGIRDFWREIFESPSALLSIRYWKHALRASAIHRLIKANSWSKSFELFYTYWFSPETTGLLWADCTPIASRAHGSDLYLESPFNRGYIPFRVADVQKLDHLILLSTEAKQYVTHRFGMRGDRITIAPLGVPDQKRSVIARRLEGDIRILSCSYPSSNLIKRVGLIALVVKEIAALSPGKKVIWTHVGGERGDYDDVSEQSVSAQNLSVAFVGAQPNEFVLDCYRRGEVSLYMTMSTTEGMPVSIMEALSFGVPVVATKVGGIPSLLREGGGMMVEVNECPKRIARQVVQLLIDENAYERESALGRSSQRKNFSAGRNYMSLAWKLLSLSAEPSSAVISKSVNQ